MPSTANAGTVVVTGAAGGIGASVARHLVELGYRVVASDVDNQRLSQLRADFPRGTLVTRTVDVADEHQVADLFADPEVSVNLVGAVLCAGVTCRATLLESTTDEANTIVHTNLFGTYFGIQSAAAALGNRVGSLVVITSINAIRALSSQAVYSATKAAMQSMVASAALELGPRGIRVNAIAPGAILTDMNAGLKADDPLAERIPLRRVGRPEDLNGAAAFLLGDASSYMTGATLVVDGGLLRLR